MFLREIAIALMVVLFCFNVAGCCFLSPVKVIRSEIPDPEKTQNSYTLWEAQLDADEVKLAPEGEDVIMIHMRREKEGYLYFFDLFTGDILGHLSVGSHINAAGFRKIGDRIEVLSEDSKGVIVSAKIVDKSTEYTVFTDEPYPWEDLFLLGQAAVQTLRQINGQSYEITLELKERFWKITVALIGDA